MARPSSYTPEIADKICEGLASGRSLSSICKDDDMPSITTVMNWLVKSEQGKEFSGFLEGYLRAREAQADKIFDECLDIADESGADTSYDESTGQIKVDGEVIQRAKLRIDTRMRMAGKLKPKKYGESQTIKGDPEAPLYDVVSLVKALDGSSLGLPKIGG